MAEPETPLVTVTPQDFWPDYETDGMQFPPENLADQKLFDRARRYDVLHRNAPEPLRMAFQMPAEALEWAREGKGTNLILWGHVGVGKSYSAVAAGTLYAAFHIKSFWFEGATKYLRTVKNHHDKDAMEEMRYDAIRPGTLVLDDIGRVKLTDVDVESITELLDERSSKLKPTIFTTNLMPPMFEDYFGDHLTSRLLGGSTVIRFEGRDRRQNP